MKKILVMAVAAMIVTSSVSAQRDELKNEVGVYYGLASASNYFSIFGGALSSAFTRGDRGNLWGPVGVEYYRHVTPVVAVGGVTSVAGCRWGDSDNLKSRYVALMPSVKFNWLRRDYWGMYSSLSAGVFFAIDKASQDNDSDIVTGSNTAVGVMFHGTALGIEAGGKFRGFAELGFGEKGVLCAGIRYKF